MFSPACLSETSGILFRTRRVSASASVKWENKEQLIHGKVLRTEWEPWTLSTEEPPGTKLTSQNVIYCNCVAFQFSSVQFSHSVVLTLCDPMNHSTSGLLVYHQLPEFTQTHVHRVGDAIQPSHPLLSPSPPAPNPSQHQGLFQWVNSSHEVAKVLEFQLQHQSIQTHCSHREVRLRS